MQCLRCGTVYEGRFCPACGAAAVPLTAIPGATYSVGWPCPRCRTLYQGNFCPRCGLPAYAAYAMPRAQGGRSVLSVLWVISIALFLLIAAMAFAGLALAPGYVLPNVPGISQGRGANPDLDVSDANWSFLRLDPTALGSYENVAGNGFLRMSAPTLPGANAIGFWWQSFEVSGSKPFFATVQLDVRVEWGSTAASATLSVFVMTTLSLPSSGEAIGTVPFSSATDWTTTPRFVTGSQVDRPGTFYVILAFAVTGTATGTPTAIDFDHIVVRWATEAGIVIYLALPDFQRLYVSQNPDEFLAYFALLLAVILFASTYHAVRDFTPAIAALRAPLEAIGARLRTRSAWFTVGQVFLATNFFQFVVIVILLALNMLPTTPLEITADNLWVILYELANASVYEEFAFRMVLLGAPLALGSLAVRTLEVRRGRGAWRGRTTATRHVSGSLRYFVGGNVTSGSPRETLLVAWAFLFFSSTVFGLAHEPGWGWWKVPPSFVAGLGFGYLFLRHGVTAAVLAHFVNDYAFSLVYMQIGGYGFTVFADLLYFGISIAGSGFFVWYILYAYRHGTGLWRKFLGTQGRPSYAPVTPVAAGALRAPASGVRQTVAPAPAAPFFPSGRDPSSIPTGYTPTYRPPPYGYPPVRFQCPSCGWVEARYDAGRFTCGRCGTTS